MGLHLSRILRDSRQVWTIQNVFILLVKRCAFVYRKCVIHVAFLRYRHEIRSLLGGAILSGFLLLAKPLKVVGLPIVDLFVPAFLLCLLSFEVVSQSHSLVILICILNSAWNSVGLRGSVIQPHFIAPPALAKDDFILIKQILKRLRVHLIVWKLLGGHLFLEINISGHRISLRG